MTNFGTKNNASLEIRDSCFAETVDVEFITKVLTNVKSRAIVTLIFKRDYIQTTFLVR